MSDKPVIFISHAHTDKVIAEILKAQIDRVFAKGILVFASSIDGTIKPGTDWLDSVENNLGTASAVVVLITPVSINRPWIWFETGAFWSKMVRGEGHIYPVCVPEIDLAELPSPLNRLQSLSLGNQKHIELFFSQLCDNFGFGNLEDFDATAIISRLPNYSDLKMDERDIEADRFYSGTFAGYSDEALKEVIDDYLYSQNKEFMNSVWKELNSNPATSYADFSDYPDDNLLRTASKEFSWMFENRKSIFSRMLIHYRKLDQELDLPPGTSKRLLKGIASNYRLRAWKEFDDCVRFEVNISTGIPDDLTQP